MNRRDFLLLRAKPGTRTIEVSCERLYMRYQDLQLASGSDAEAGALQYDPSFGEPPAVFERRTPEEFFADLERQLRSADVVTLVGEEWLQPEELRANVHALVAHLQRDGVRVVWC